VHAPPRSPPRPRLQPSSSVPRGDCDSGYDRHRSADVVGSKTSRGDRPSTVTALASTVAGGSTVDSCGQLIDSQWSAAASSLLSLRQRTIAGLGGEVATTYSSGVASASGAAPAAALETACDVKGATARAATARGVAPRRRESDDEPSAWLPARASPAAAAERCRYAAGASLPSMSMAFGGVIPTAASAPAVAVPSSPNQPPSGAAVSIPSALPLPPHVTLIFCARRPRHTVGSVASSTTRGFDHGAEDGAAPDVEKEEEEEEEVRAVALLRRSGSNNGAPSRCDFELRLRQAPPSVQQRRQSSSPWATGSGSSSGSGCSSGSWRLTYQPWAARLVITAPDGATVAVRCSSGGDDGDCSAQDVDTRAERPLSSTRLDAAFTSSSPSVLPLLSTLPPPLLGLAAFAMTAFGSCLRAESDAVARWQQQQQQRGPVSGVRTTADAALSQLTQRPPPFPLPLLLVLRPSQPRPADDAAWPLSTALAEGLRAVAG
jgi:hypothetical protein